MSEVVDRRPCRGRNGNVCVAEGCYGEACLSVAPVVTENPRKRCQFGRPHHWCIGAFYWPLSGQLDGTATLYVGDDYVMCAQCGQIESDR